MPELIPVITLWQPWASLIFTGDKKHETRGFPFPGKHAGRRIAIHSALKMPKEISVGLHLLCESNWGADEAWREQLPRGYLLGTVELVRSHRTEEVTPDPVDRICGNWEPGRFAWELRDPRPLADPLTATGKQGWWSVESIVLGAGHAD